MFGKDDCKEDVCIMEYSEYAGLKWGQLNDNDKKIF